MNVIEYRMALVMLDQGEFTADDVTLNGSVTIDQDHQPNAKQNTVGSVFNSFSRRGLIVFTERVVRSTAPHRKGGTNKVWRATPKGLAWAKKNTDPPKRVIPPPDSY